MIITDLSDRERRRFVTQLEQAAQLTGNVAAALATHEDGKAAMHFALMSSILPMVMVDLSDVFCGAIDVEIPSHPDTALKRDE